MTTQAETLISKVASLLEVEELQSKSRAYYETRELHQEDRELARLLMLGVRPKQIAKALGVSLQHVYCVRNSPAMQEHLARLNAAADRELCSMQGRIAALLPDAMGVIDDAIHDEAFDQGKKVDAAFKLLSIGGYGPSSTVKGEHVHALVDADLLRELNADLPPTIEALNVSVEEVA